MSTAARAVIFIIILGAIAAGIWTLHDAGGGRNAAGRDRDAGTRIRAGTDAARGAHAAAGAARRAYAAGDAARTVKRALRITTIGGAAGWSRRFSRSYNDAALRDI